MHGKKLTWEQRIGKDVFEELLYTMMTVRVWWEGNSERFSKSKVGSDQPLVLAICTLLMARVHEHVKQAGKIMFVYFSSSLDDFNNPMFILSTSSPAGGLPLGFVITSGEV